MSFKLDTENNTILTQYQTKWPTLTRCSFFLNLYLGS